MNSLIRDIRFALRQLRRSPGFAVTVILTMALGIGANAIVFSVLNTLVLRPLNFPGSDRIYFLNRLDTLGQGWRTSPSQSYPDYRDMRDKNAVFSGLAAYRVNQSGVEYNGAAAKTWIYESTDNYFDLLGVQ